MRLDRLILFLATFVPASIAVAAELPVPNFEQQVAQLLKNRCVKCHGPAKREGELDLSVPAAMARGGASGAVVVLGNPDGSLLWQRVAADEMPEDEPLTAHEKQILRRWIESGAPGLPAQDANAPDGAGHWAFQSLPAPALPAVRETARLRTAIDAFIAARLEAAGLSLGPEADRAVLIRRLSFDLTGLPPTPEEIAAFLGDASESAYERLVDRYLASPRYGERWGKYWLDAAGYADSNGYFSADTDRPLAYRYRDYVIRSINADKPFDRFLCEQLAGDELAGYGPGMDVLPETVELLEATHFLRNSQDGTDSSDGNPDEQRIDKYSVLEGTVEMLGSALFGLKLQCARCHDHKFEPVSQREYYQLQAVLYPAFNIENWIKPAQRTVNAASAEELAAWEAQSRELDQQTAALRQQFAQWFQQNRPRGTVRFQDGFDQADAGLAAWSNTAPGDLAPAGQPPVKLNSAAAPAAQAAEGVLQIVESGAEGDRAISTRQVFDWTPDAEGGWIEATFDLVEADAAPYVGYFIALADFNDANQTGGSVLLDGASSGGATVHADYPGADSNARGRIGASGYQAGHNYGVRVTNLGGGMFQLEQLVDGVPEEPAVVLSPGDLPDGGFGFEYCCSRSFTVDNVRVESSDEAVDAAAMQQLAEMLRGEREKLEAAVAEVDSRRTEKPGQLAPVTDLAPEPPDVYLLERGDYAARAETVGPGGLAAVSELSNPADFALRDASLSSSTGRRLALARWLTQPDSRAAALLARVTVNRFWQKHFGTGIVSTVDNLGYSGAPPLHPELLDYLAAELIASGWSAKAVHRLVLRSAVYRQSSLPRAEGDAIDPDNRLLWRFPLRRLDAEAIRDAMLAVSGELDTRPGGPYVPTARGDDGDVVVDEQHPGARRRSVYLQQRRTQVLGLLDVFDAPSIVVNCTQRTPTTVPLQSLKLLNSDFSRRRAAAMAERLAREAGPEMPPRIERAFLLAFGRAPKADELAAAQQFMAAERNEYLDQLQADGLAWTDFCQMLLAGNAFLYVE